MADVDQGDELIADRDDSGIAAKPMRRVGLWLQRLDAGLPPADYLARRGEAAKALNMPRDDLDKLVKGIRAEKTKAEKTAKILEAEENGGALFDWMNKRHFVITIGSSTLIGELTRDELGNDGVMVLSKVKDFTLRYSNRYVTSLNQEAQRVSLYRPTGYHRKRRQYTGADIIPGEPQNLPDGKLNLWGGYGRTPKQGDWPLSHIWNILACKDQGSYNYIIRWIAWVLQHPTELAEAILVFQGGKRVGKGTLLHAITLCLGKHGFEIRHGTGRETRRRKVSCKATSQKKAKPPIFGHGRKRRLPASKDERRYAVLKVADTYTIGVCRAETRKAYFSALQREMNNGGIEAMLHDGLGAP